MRHIPAIFFIPIILLCFRLRTENNPIYRCSSCKPPKEQRTTNANETAQVVVNNFLMMLPHFITMIQNPHDQKNFNASLLAIAHALGAIALQASKSNNIEDEQDALQTKKLCLTDCQNYEKNGLPPEEIHGLYAKYAAHFDTLTY